MFSTRYMVLVVVLVSIFVIGCGKTNEEIATEAAQEWTENSFDAMEDILGFFLGSVPVISQIASSAIMDQLQEKVVWSLQTPDCSEDNYCTVLANAKTDVDVFIPLVVDDTASISVPFFLRIDTSSKEVDHWRADFDRASISGINVRKIRNVTEDVIDRSRDVNLEEAAEDIEEFVEEFEEPISDVSEGIKNLFGGD